MEVEIINEPVKETNYDLSDVNCNIESTYSDQIDELKQQQDQLVKPLPPKKEYKAGDTIQCKFKTKEVQEDGTKSIVTKEGSFKIDELNDFVAKLSDSEDKQYSVSLNLLEILDPEQIDLENKYKKELKEFNDNAKEIAEAIKELKRKEKEAAEKAKEEYLNSTVELGSLDPKDQLRSLIDSDMKNIWMVGAAGSGNSITL